MVSTVSHELKTPLTSVQMAVHLLLEEVVAPLTPKQIELLLAGASGCRSHPRHDQRPARLTCTRIEQGRAAGWDLQPVLAVELVDGAAARMQSRADDASITLDTEVDRELACVMVDRIGIEHVFDNLIVNAIQHTPRGGTIRIEVQPEGDRIRFRVRDTGEGIPREHLPRIFEKFYRIPGAQQAGVGLGLAIVREILTAHGGQIDVSSNPGRGTAFTFTLPACRDAHDSADSGKTVTCSQRNAS